VGDRAGRIKVHCGSDYGGRRDRALARSLILGLRGGRDDVRMEMMRDPEGDSVLETGKKKGENAIANGRKLSASLRE